MPDKKAETLTKPQGCLAVIVLMVFIIWLIIPSEDETSNTPSTDDTSSVQNEWYVGGTLHEATADQWNAASYDNKLATCGDFVATMWTNESFKPELMESINSMDDTRALASELVKALDKTFEADEANTAENVNVMNNVKVNESAVLLMTMMGWL